MLHGSFLRIAHIKYMRAFVSLARCGFHVSPFRHPVGSSHLYSVQHSDIGCSLRRAPPRVRHGLYLILILPDIHIEYHTSSPRQERPFFWPPFFQYNKRLLRQKTGGACLYMPQDGH